MTYVFIFLIAVAVSFIVSVPIGGVNVAVFQATLNHNRTAGYMIGFGAIVAEAIYCAIPLFGLTPFLEGTGIMDVLYIIFIPALFLLGVLSIKNRNKKAKSDKSTGVGAHNRTYKGYFIYGFFLCLSNPMTLIFWIQAVVLLRQKEVINDQMDQILAYYLGVPVGTWLLYFCFVWAAAITRKKINDLWHMRINVAIGVIFIFLSLYLAVGYFWEIGQLS